MDSSAFVTFADLFTYTIVLLTAISVTAAGVFKLCQWMQDQRDKHDHDEKKK